MRGWGGGGGGWVVGFGVVCTEESGLPGEGGLDSANANAETTPARHRPQRPSERSDLTQHAKGRTGDCPGPREETAT